MSLRPDEARTVLGVSAAAGAQTIRAAWKRESFRWHPDRHPGREEAAHERFCRLAEAAALLLREARSGPSRGATPDAVRSGLGAVIREAESVGSSRARAALDEEMLAILRAWQRERWRAGRARLDFYAHFLATLVGLGASALLNFSALALPWGFAVLGLSLGLFARGLARRADLTGRARRTRLFRDARARMHRAQS